MRAMCGCCAPTRRLRYDLDFLVLRLDFGVGLHAPYTTAKSGFYNIERFKDGFAFHFAIGYPF